MDAKLWDGRFTESTHQLVEKFTSSISVDQRLFDYDIQGSTAHCKMLARVKVITLKEAETLINGLAEIRTELEQGQFKFEDRLEDIHMHIEARLFQKLGPVALKLHTARSRNDQVALDVRLYLRAETRIILELLLQWRKVLIKIAQDQINTILPGYTHLQRAQPILLSHHVLAYFEMFSRDSRRFEDALEGINVMPLGSAALAGTTYPIDRHFTAQLLNFKDVSDNSIDAVSDRDFLIEFLSAASICMMHFSRLSEELILWASSEFNFITLPDAFATGSSIMPQKKNPDIPELVRGKTGRVYGHLLSLLTMMKSLPLAYNRDMQEDKHAMFDSVDTLKACLEIYTAMLPTISFNKEKMGCAATTGFLNATDMADYLASKGMPFRKAHACAGQAVAYALKQGKELDELELKQLKEFSSLFENDIYKCMEPETTIARRQSYGGTSSVTVLAAIQKAKGAVNWTD